MDSELIGQEEEKQIEVEGTDLKDEDSDAPISVSDEEMMDEEQQELVKMEMFGEMKRWNEVRFVHRMRNLRA